MTTSPHKPWSAAQVGRIKPLVFLVILYPLLRWFWLGLQGGLTANPQEYLTRSSGLWAVIALLLTLSITPVRRLIQQPALLRLRRMLGLTAFFYTALHILAWALWDRSGSWTAMWQDITGRTFITVGTVASIPLLLLALTSTKGWMRRLGSRWQLLHRTIYPIAALSIWHFWLVRSGKNDFLEPYLYAALVSMLLILRYMVRLPAKARLSKHITSTNNRNNSLQTQQSECIHKNPPEKIKYKRN